MPQDHQAVGRGEHARQPDRRAVTTVTGLLAGPGAAPLGVGADRQGAPTAELGQEGTLGLDEAVPTGLVDGRQRRRQSASSWRHSTASAPWPTWGSISPGSSTSVSRPAGGVQPSRSMAALATTTAATSPVPAAAKPGGQVPAELGEGEVRTQVGQLGPAPGRAGGHRGPGGQGGEAAAHQDVAGVGPVGHRGQHQAGDAALGRRRQVLGRVHGGVGLAVDDRGPAPR